MTEMKLAGMTEAELEAAMVESMEEAKFKQAAQWRMLWATLRSMKANR